MRISIAVIRVFFAGLITAAVVAQLQLSLMVWAEAGIEDPTIQLVNFFSFFTIESNVASIVVLLIGAALLVTRTGEDPRWFTLLRLAVVTYMATTGVVYNLLLRGIELPQGSTVPWSNEVLHVVGPVWLILDWLLAPGRPAVAWRAIGAVVVFPLLWGAYTLVRGPLVFDEMTDRPFWYPYPFMNPNNSENGYLSVVFYMILIAVIIGVVSAGAIALSRRFPQRPSVSDRATA